MTGFIELTLVRAWVSMDWFSLCLGFVFLIGLFCLGFMFLIGLVVYLEFPLLQKGLLCRWFQLRTVAIDLVLAAICLFNLSLLYAY